MCVWAAILATLNPLNNIKINSHYRRNKCCIGILKPKTGNLLKILTTLSTQIACRHWTSWVEMWWIFYHFKLLTNLNSLSAHLMQILLKSWISSLPSVIFLDFLKQINIMNIYCKCFWLPFSLLLCIDKPFCYNQLTP